VLLSVVTYAVVAVPPVDEVSVDVPVVTRVVVAVVLGADE
jgi:hypothetical protein